ncbi:MAG: Holliday junction resolvase RuvX [Chloroflexi bacterium]|nr:Holliday junction resolvase RuvX [Chloroflexota bacterium]
MRWLAVDPGERYVGLAICDPDERVAVPLEVVAASAAFPAVRAIVDREGVGGVVVGLPLTERGEEGEAARMARRLGERLRRGLAVPVAFADERFTSAAAARAGRPAARGDRRDDLAAAILLQQFIDERRSGAGRGEGEGDATP